MRYGRCVYCGGLPVRGQTFGHVGGWRGLRRVRVEGTKLHNFVQVEIPVGAAPTTGAKVIRQNGRAQQLAPPFDHPQTCPQTTNPARHLLRYHSPRFHLSCFF